MPKIQFQQLQRGFKHCAWPLCLALLLMAALQPGMALSANFDTALTSTDANKSDGKSRAAAQAQAAYGGKVLSVSEETRNGRTVYKVKLLLDSGRIKIVTIAG